ncbi:MAG: hypothetical protein RIQ53_678 [Pseudomonadota bacterium]
MAQRSERRARGPTLPPPAAAATTDPAARVFDEFESLRGIAALLVVLNHVPAWNPQLYAIGFVRQSGLMVDLFFVLSGFIIHTAYARRLRTGRELAGFMANRFARLYPLHLVTLLFFGAIELARQNSGALGMVRQNAGLYQDATVGVFIEHLLLLQAIPPFHDILTFNSPSWSIGVEFYTYLLFGVTVLGLGPRAHRVFGLLVLASLAVLISGVWPVSHWFLRGLCGFMTGALVARWWASYPRAGRPAPATVPAWASELLLVAIVGVLALADRLPPTWPGLLVMALTVAYVACALGRRPGAPGPLAQLMRTRPLMWLGTLSFTFYLLHGPVFWVMNNLARHALKWPEALVAGSWKPQATVVGAAGWTLLSLAVMLAVSHAVWRVYEVPAREAIRRWAARRLGRAQAPA